MKRKRILTSLLSFVFLFSFLAVTPASVFAATNLASGKLPTSSVAFTNLSRVTDGNRSTSNYADSYTNKGINWIQINLGSPTSINNIKLWHYFGDSRKYHDVVVQLSNDANFNSGVTTVYNNDTDNSATRGTGSDSEYTETSAGLNITFDGVSAQYVRFYSNGSTVNSYNHYVEVEIYQGTTRVTGNLAAGKTTTSSQSFTGLSKVTDSIVDTTSYADSYTNSGLQWIQMDLGAAYNLNNIKLWHYYGDTRKYHDVVVQVSNSADFTNGITTVYNNDTDNSANRGTGSNSEYAETSAGLHIDFGATSARYVRIYSNGSTANGYNHYVEVEVYASAATVNPASVSLNKDTDTVAIGGTDTLTATVLPADATNKNITWKSSDTSIATVANGVITPVAAGSATITVTTAVGGFTDTCDVTVVDTAIHPDSVSLNKPSTTIAAGSSETLTATVLPSNATNKNVTWKSSNTSVAIVANGVVTAVSAGSATITASTADGGKTATCAVTVTAATVHPTGVTLNNSSINLKVAGTDTLTATVLPANSDNKAVTWSSSSNAIATVSASGLVTGMGAGTATITVKTADGGKTATCTVTVASNQASGNLAAGKTPTASTAFTNIARITDSDVTMNNYSDSYPNSGLQWIQIDLGSSKDINTIDLWHYFGDSRKYHDVIIKLSNDSSFSSGVSTVYNNDTNNSSGLGTGKDTEYTETSSGLNVRFNTITARYVRFYSNGSTANNYNHYVEAKISYDPNQAVTPVTSYNLATGKQAAASTAFANTSYITDGVTDTVYYSDSYPASGVQWMQLDLGVSYGVNNIKLWHYYGDTRQYHDVIVQLSNDANFSSGVTTVYNNDTNGSAGRGTGSNSEYTETSTGLDISFNAVNARYVRLYSNGSSKNNYNHYVDVQVYDGITQKPAASTPNDLSSNITPSSSSAFSNIAAVTDSIKTDSNVADSYPTEGLQWIQVDLGSSYSIDYIRLWHYYSDGRKYHDVIVQISNDSSFASGVTTVYNNDTNNSAGRGTGSNSEYNETSSGLDIAFGATKARYVRFYSNGSTANNSNHYTEIDVYAMTRRLPLINASSYLNVPTYDGEDMSVHPSVVYFENGWNGYKYWLVSTPYPYSNDDYENPEITASNDGLNFEVPQGLKNPLAPMPAVGHNCDPELFYNNKTDELWIYYLEANDINTTYVKFMKSSNGVNWTSAKTIITDSRSAYETISPTVDYMASTGLYYMWTVNLGNEALGVKDNYVELRTSTNGTTWSAPTTVSNFTQDSAEVWHLYIRYIPAYKEYWCIFAGYPDGGDVGDTMLYFAKSLDGVNWTTYYNSPVLEKGATGAWDAGNVYRSCFVYNASTDTLKVWYSSVGAVAKAGMWQIGYTSNTYTNFYYNLIY
jgi:uncharacterized protein YjdB